MENFTEYLNIIIFILGLALATLISWVVTNLLLKKRDRELQLKESVRNQIFSDLKTPELMDNLYFELSEGLNDSLVVRKNLTGLSITKENFEEKMEVTLEEVKVNSKGCIETKYIIKEVKSLGRNNMLNVTDTIKVAEVIDIITRFENEDFRELVNLRTCTSKNAEYSYYILDFQEVN